MTRCQRCHGASGGESGQFDMEAELSAVSTKCSDGGPRPLPFSFAVLKDAHLTQKGQCDLP